RIQSQRARTSLTGTSVGTTRPAATSSHAITIKTSIPPLRRGQTAGSEQIRDRAGDRRDGAGGAGEIGATRAPRHTAVGAKTHSVLSLTGPIVHPGTRVIFVTNVDDLVLFVSVAQVAGPSECEG